MARKGRVLSPLARAYKKGIEEHTMAQIKEQDRNGHKYTDQILDLQDKELIVAVILCSSWYTKTDTIRRKDCQNYSKALLDSIWTAFKALNPLLDDSQIWSFSINKIEVSENGGNEYTEVIIKSIEDNLESMENE
jgi:Holliday junction resolvase RusA-like endonuclease